MPHLYFHVEVDARAAGDGFPGFGHQLGRGGEGSPRIGLNAAGRVMGQKVGVQFGKIYRPPTFAAQPRFVQQAARPTDRRGF